MKADLHCHSCYSGYAKIMPALHARDCYSRPEDVYRVARARGMDLVCLTDHDTLDGGLAFLDAHPDTPDFILGEEIECRVPDAPGLRVHLGAVGMTERAHRDLQPLRDNAFDVAEYLRTQDIFFSVNHLFLLYRDELPAERYVREMIALGAPGLEVHNGAASRAHNALVGAIADALGRGGRPVTSIGGSDAHTLRWVGSSYTETPSRTREEFLADLCAGRSRVGGQHGGRARAFSEIYGVVARYWASLVGFEPWELPTSTRLKASALAAMLLPFQFVPAVVALRLKSAEARRVRRCAAELGGPSLPELVESLSPAVGRS